MLLFKLSKIIALGSRLRFAESATSVRRTIIAASVARIVCLFTATFREKLSCSKFSSVKVYNTNIFYKSSSLIFNPCREKDRLVVIA